jgi:hypothetical protein
VVARSFDPALMLINSFASRRGLTGVQVTYRPSQKAADVWSAETNRIVRIGILDLTGKAA